ncbi:protein rhsA [Escherichia coli O104:H4 str. C236-11]|nr:protein rhsA [Escherichia coli O104:H4 str. C236-11]
MAEPLVESRYLYDPLAAGWQNGYGDREREPDGLDVAVTETAK